MRRTGFWGCHITLPFTSCFPEQSNCSLLIVSLRLSIRYPSTCTLLSVNVLFECFRKLMSLHFYADHYQWHYRTWKLYCFLKWYNYKGMTLKGFRFFFSFIYPQSFCVGCWYLGASAYIQTGTLWAFCWHGLGLHVPLKWVSIWRLCFIFRGTAL